MPPRKWVALYKFLAARNTSHEMLYTPFCVSMLPCKLASALMKGTRSAPRCACFPSSRTPKFRKNPNQSFSPAQSRRQTSNPHDSVPHCAAGAGCVTTSRASTGEPGAARRSDHGCGRAPDSVAGAAAPKCFFSLRREGAKCKSSAAQRFFFGRSAPDTCTSARTSLCSSAVSRVTWQT